MRKLRVGQDFTIFVLFFGAALFESLRYRDWLMALVFVALGLMFLRAPGNPQLVRNDGGVSESKRAG